MRRRAGRGAARDVAAGQGVSMSAPDYLEPLLVTQTGQFMLMAAGVWMSIGIFVMKNMISIKV